MKSMQMFCLVVGIVYVNAAQEVLSTRVRGLRVYGSTEANLPVAKLKSQPITIEFDLLSNDAAAPAMQLRFIHCDRNWQATSTSFVNDEMRNRTKSDIPSEVAPNGVQGYSFHYTAKIPSYPFFDGFSYSGNYVFELRDANAPEVLGRGRFFVTEDRVVARMKVTNRQEPSGVSPYYEVNAVSVAFTVPRRDSLSSYERSFFNVVDIYKNKELTRPRRVSTDDDDAHTFVNGFGTDRMEFIVDNMEPGSEYRTLDLRDPGFYPHTRTLRSRNGADVSRFLGRMQSDHNGGSTLVRGTSYAGYLDFRFELNWQNGPIGPVYVVGDFNGWKVEEGSMMSLEGDRFIKTVALRRGEYDYQYVVGNDWIMLEGNSWSTINTYTAFVYYRDERYGGFDRILGSSQVKSPGGKSATSN